MVAAQKHADGRVPEVRGQRKTLGLHSVVFSELADGNTQLNYENDGKNSENRSQLRKLG